MEVSFYTWGDFGCFADSFSPSTVSYRVITPTAARKIMESVFGKPEFAWMIKQIKVIKLGTMMGVRTKACKEGLGQNFRQNRQIERTLKSDLILHDIAYGITATVFPIKTRRDGTNPYVGYVEQFVRRLERGECFTTPFMGRKEYIANVSLKNPFDCEEVRSFNMGLMRMEHIFVRNQSNDHLVEMFECDMKNGVIDIPQDKMRSFWETYRAKISV